MLVDIKLYEVLTSRLIFHIKIFYADTELRQEEVCC